MRFPEYRLWCIKKARTNNIAAAHPGSALLRAFLMMYIFKLLLLCGHGHLHAACF
jgi:hypothetical protein